MGDKKSWNDNDIQQTINRLDPKQLYVHEKMGQVLLKKNFENATNIDAVTQIFLMLRDGLNPDMLEDNERALFLTCYDKTTLESFRLK